MKYEHYKYSYMLSDTAYTNLTKQAEQHNFIPVGAQISRGLSYFIESATIAPSFTPDELQLVEGSKLYTYSNSVWLNGEYRYARKIAISEQRRQQLAAIGLKYKLYQKQATDTALVSGVLEAWGNGKFTCVVNQTSRTPVKRVNTYFNVVLTTSQWNWLYHLAVVFSYEPMTGSETPHRGYSEFIKDIRYVDLEPYPFDKSIVDPDPNVPPLTDPNERSTILSLQTHPNLQAVFERDLWIPRMPGWYDCLPEPLNPPTTALEAAVL